MINFKGPQYKPKEPKDDQKSMRAPQAVFTKKENATLSQRIEILDWHHANGEISRKWQNILIRYIPT